MSWHAVLQITSASAASLLLVACRLLDPRPAAVPEPRPSVSPQTARHIAQRGSGPDAYFTHCTDSTCPRVTSKVMVKAHKAGLATPPLVSTPMAALPAPATASSPEGKPMRPPAARTAVPGTATADKLTLHFSENAARLTEAHKARLNEAFDNLRTSDLIVISGRTDSVGGEAVNSALALARGLAVRDHLLDLDPALPARIAIDARGRCCYLATNATVAGRASNRRVEVAHRQADREMP